MYKTTTTMKTTTGFQLSPVTCIGERKKQAKQKLTALCTLRQVLGQQFLWRQIGQFRDKSQLYHQNSLF